MQQIYLYGIEILLLKLNKSGSCLPTVKQSCVVIERTAHFSMKRPIPQVSYP